MTGRALLLEACARPFAAAQAARAEGQAVIAYVGTAVPHELIRAAGAFALQLAGDPALPTPLADRYLDDEYDGAIRSLFDQIAGGAADVADLIVIPRASNGLLYLYYSLVELRRLKPDMRFPEPVLYDVLNTPNWATSRHVLGRTRALHARLGGTADTLRAAIREANAVRHALCLLNARRRAGRLLGSTWWAALRASTTLAPHDWHAAVAALADETAPPGRLMLKGAAQDTPDLYLLAESLGANVVADDCLDGERTVQARVDEDVDPLLALAGHYQLHVPTVRSYPQAAQDAAWLALLEESGARAVVFCRDEFDDTLGWDYPAQKALLDARGVPHALLAGEPYRTPGPATRAALRASLFSDLIARIPA